MRNRYAAATSGRRRFQIYATDMFSTTKALEMRSCSALPMSDNHAENSQAQQSQRNEGKPRHGVLRDGNPVAKGINEQQKKLQLDNSNYYSKHVLHHQIRPTREFM